MNGGTSGHWNLASIFGSARRRSSSLFTGALRSVGIGSGRGRRVRFQPKATVLEFERELFGGGGVPDADNVSLGLSPKLVDTYSVALAEKQGKDEYAASGYLELSVKVELLSQWADEPVLQGRLDGDVALQIERTRRERLETASSRRDQRQMPASIIEALEMAQKDALAARRVAAAALHADGEEQSSRGNGQAKRGASMESGTRTPSAGIGKRRKRRESI